MHVAALAPQFANRDGVSAKALADEREIARAKAVAAGKPEAVVEKMVEGMIGKWYGEVVLLDQPFAKDDSKKVSQVIAERAGKDAVRRPLRALQGGRGHREEGRRLRRRSRRADQVRTWKPATAGSC